MLVGLALSQCTYQVFENLVVLFRLNCLVDQIANRGAGPGS